MRRSDLTRRINGIAFCAFLVTWQLIGTSPSIAVPTPSAISVSANNQPLRTVLLALAQRYGLNIVVAPGVDGRVTIDVHDLSVDQALTAILEPLGLTYRRAGSVIEVGQPAQPQVSATAQPQVPTVIALTTISADHALNVVRRLYPHVTVSTDTQTNSLIVQAPQDQASAIRSLLQAIDVQNPTTPAAQAIQLHTADPRDVATKIGALYPNARIALGPNRSVLVRASPQDLNEIRSLITSMDTSTATPAPNPPQAEAVKLAQAKPQDVARAVAAQYRDLRVSVSGQNVIMSGPPDEIAQAKQLVALLDIPPANTRITQVYRLKNVDAKSVADLVARSFGDAQVTPDEELNALSVTATVAEQQRITDAIAQLDSSQNGANMSGGPPVQQPGAIENAGSGPGGGNVEIVTLKAAIAGANGTASTSATDIATTVTQALQSTAPDLRITVPNDSTQLVLTGSPYSIKLARQLIEKLDVAPPLVVLDTEVLELDETVARNLGLLYPPAVSTTYSELTPTTPPNPAYTQPQIGGFQAFTRTTLQNLTVSLNALIQNGTARVLADPRITTISGRTASIRAGDNISILVTGTGGIGTVVTSSVQQFQTGVTLDITPVVNLGNTISVTLHPNVSSLTGFINNVPQIATRETQTTVTLQNDQTLVIGGLIQENATRTETKVPLLGDVPLVGRLFFRNQQVNYTRNELIIVVTPHVLAPGASPALPGPVLPSMPTPRPLPTLPAGTQLPPAGGQLQTSQPAGIPLVPSSTQPSRLPAPLVTVPAATYRYGSEPASNVAKDKDPLRIYSVTMSPTVIGEGTTIALNAITSTNAVRLTLGAGSLAIPITQIGPGKWAANVEISASSLQATTSPALTLTAYRADGVATSIAIPVSVAQ